jgi:hypothetical protein
MTSLVKLFGHLNNKNFDMMQCQLAYKVIGLRNTMWLRRGSTSSHYNSSYELMDEIFETWWTVC